MDLRAFILLTAIVAPTAVSAESSPPDRAAPTGQESGQYRCGDKKYCKDMTSCAEARFHMTECKQTNLDRDGDGVPCENVCKR